MCDWIKVFAPIVFVIFYFSLGLIGHDIDGPPDMIPGGYETNME